MHGNGSQERFFEFVLDFVSLLIDGKSNCCLFRMKEPTQYFFFTFTEVPKELKKASLLLLGSMHSELTYVPAMFHSRVKRIMPFLTHNVYLANTKLASSILGLPPTNDPQQQQQHLETCLEQSKPWEWLEDYVSEPPHDNDAPISLSLFNARKSKKADSTYVRWFKFGFDEGPSISASSSVKAGAMASKSRSATASPSPSPSPSLQRKRRLQEAPGHISSVEIDRKKDEVMDENGFIFIVDDEDNEMNSKSNGKKKKVEMEEGELP